MSDPITLYPFQEEAAAWLQTRRRAYLADVPRLGKTDAVCKALRELAPDMVVIVCPAAVTTAWRRKLALWQVPRTEVWSYEKAVKRVHDISVDLQGPTTVLVLDEAHYLANRETERTKRLLGPLGPTRTATHVWCVSGTPMSKHPGQLFPVLASLFPGVLARFAKPNYKGFLKRFTWGIHMRVHSHHVEYKPMGAKDAQVLHEALFHPDERDGLRSAPFLRRTEADVEAQFPPMTWEIIPLAVTGGKAPSRELSMVEARQRAGTLKMDALAAQLRARLQEPGPIVLLAHFLDTLAQLRAIAVEERGEENVSFVTGDIQGGARDREIDLFQSGQRSVFIGSLRACQTGITLSAANELWIVEPDWTADVNIQGGKRCVAMHKTAPCVTKLFVLADSIDEAIIRSHLRELEMSGAVLDDAPPAEADLFTVAA